MIIMTDKDVCCTSESDTTTCKVEAVVSVDERGQMVLPKELRERADIHAGDKLALVGHERDGLVCCISLIKADTLSGVVKDVLSPMFTELR